MCGCFLSSDVKHRIYWEPDETMVKTTCGQLPGALKMLGKSVCWGTQHDVIALCERGRVTAVIAGRFKGGGLYCYVVAGNDKDLQSLAASIAHAAYYDKGYRSEVDKKLAFYLRKRRS